MRIKKGQASLEMIIGLIILLVLAGIVISMIMQYLNPKNLPKPEERIEIQKFLGECEQLCKGGEYIKYCSTYSENIEDWDGNDERYELINVGDQEWPACEGKVYCFLVKPCKKLGSSTNKIMEKCAKLLCQNFLEKYSKTENPIKKASEKVREMVDPETEKCSFDVDEEEDWYAQFFPEDVCNLTKYGK